MPNQMGPGYAVPLGGALKYDNQEVWSRLVQLSGGEGTRWVVIPIAAGNPLVAYREGGTNPSREIFARWSTDGGRSFGEAMQINKQKTLEDG